MARLPLDRVWQAVRYGLSRAKPPPLSLRVRPHATRHALSTSPNVLRTVIEWLGPLWKATPLPSGARLHRPPTFIRAPGTLKWTPSPLRLQPSLSRPMIGMQSARGFSTNTTPFANVVHNAPFGIRALVDSGLFSFDDFKERQAKVALALSNKPESTRKPLTRLSSFTSSLATSELPSELPFSSDEMDTYLPVSQESLELPSVRLLFRPPRMLCYDEHYAQGGPRIGPSASDRQHWLEQARLCDERWQAVIDSLTRALGAEGEQWQVFDFPSSGQRQIDFWHLSLNDVRQAMGLWETDAYVRLIDLNSTSSPPTSDEDLESDSGSHSMVGSPLMVADSDWNDLGMASTLILPSAHGYSIVRRPSHE